MSRSALTIQLLHKHIPRPVIIERTFLHVNTVVHFQFFIEPNSRVRRFPKKIYWSQWWLHRRFSQNKINIHLAYVRAIIITTQLKSVSICSKVLALKWTTLQDSPWDLGKHSFNWEYIVHIFGLSIDQSSHFSPWYAKLKDRGDRSWSFHSNSSQTVQQGSNLATEVAIIFHRRIIYVFQTKGWVT